jgi:sulfur-oxidizing protein SoxX
MIALLLAATPAQAADPARGRALVADRQTTQCALCHPLPNTPPHLQGDLAPDLRGIGARLTPAELRLRLTEPNPDSIMPAYARTSGLTNPGRAFANRPLLPDAAIDDIVAYLTTLTDAP